VSRQRKLVALSAAAAVVATLVVGVTLISGGSGDADTSAGGAGDSGPTTAEVVRKDLAETKSVAGTLGYGDSEQISFARPGTVTGLAAVGAIVGQGEVLGEVDAEPVILFIGDRPVWRTLEAGVSDGPDVEQLEANLIELGYGTAGNLGPNEVWSQATTEAVKRWQRAVGLDDTGVVRQGDIVFEPAAVRISGHLGQLGSPSGGPTLEATGTTKSVAVDLDVDDQDLAAVGGPVQVELPDGSFVAGTITAVGSVAATQEGGATIPVTIVLDDQAAGEGLDDAPVSVQLTTALAADVLAVPVKSLLALAEGGYAVEVVTGLGTTQLVAVKAGTFASGWVEVSGELEPGDQVVVPR
jgi:peptidoglycan hydrolase-like protein with peptidoglycan-binding domain